MDKNLLQIPGDNNAYDDVETNLPANESTSLQTDKDKKRSPEYDDAEIQPKDGDTSPSDYPSSAFGEFAGSVRKLSYHLQVPEAMAGSVLLATTAALAQPFLNICATERGKGMPISLYMLIIAESGERKSSTIDAVVDCFRPVLRRAEDQRSMMLFNDPSIDGVIASLVYRCVSQFLLAPEGASLLGSHAMNKDSLPRFAGTMASLYSGEALSRVRVKEQIYAEDRRLSMLVSAQPQVSLGFLSNPMVMQQGLGNRFLYCWPESRMGSRKLMRTALHEHVEYQQLASRLEELATHPWEIDEHSGGVKPTTIHLSSGAWEQWESLFNTIESELCPGGNFVNHAGYVNRFAEQVLRISAVLAALENPQVSVVSEDVMTHAIELGTYYLDTALHIFEAAPANVDEQDANSLLNWMRNKSRELNLPAIPARTIYKDGPRCARPSKRTKELLDILITRGDVIKYDSPVRYGDGKRSNDNYAAV